MTMTKKHTPQLLGRTSNLFDLEPEDAFAFLGKMAERTDFRRSIAAVVMWELKELADLRVAKKGTTWRDEWPYVFEPQLLVGDLSSEDPERYRAARRAEDAGRDLMASMQLFATSLAPDEMAEAYARIVRRVRKRLGQIDRAMTGKKSIVQPEARR
jgi:hypothetical protein